MWVGLLAATLYFAGAVALMSAPAGTISAIQSAKLGFGTLDQVTVNHCPLCSRTVLLTVTTISSSSNVLVAWTFIFSRGFSVSCFLHCTTERQARNIPMQVQAKSLAMRSIGYLCMSDIAARGISCRMR